ncbi:MAG: rod-binding protein [Spirochaetia bacterium]|nr:rod-binding protein [Spirochaetota bacterium]MDW8111916.1 rod-binding protein [Spirochaetia bacterium]
MVNSIDYTSLMDVVKVESVKDKIRSANLTKLREVAEEFEAIFVNMMLKEMRKSINETGFLKGFREDIFRDLLYWEYAKLISRNTSLGISEKIQDLYKNNL